MNWSGPMIFHTAWKMFKNDCDLDDMAAEALKVRDFLIHRPYKDPGRGSGTISYAKLKPSVIVMANLLKAY